MSDWISVDDRLPEIDENSRCYEEYNVYCVQTGMEIVTTLSFTEHGWGNDDKWNWDLFVTHWQPLPEPPKQED